MDIKLSIYKLFFVKNNFLIITISTFFLTSCLGDPKEEKVTLPLWVTAGFGKSLISYDTDDWNASSTIQSGITFRSITGGKTFGEFIVVGNNGLIYKSSDNGSTWESKTSGTSNRLWEISLFGDLYIAVGISGTILTSNDGDSWVTRTASGVSEHLRGVAFGNSKYVIGGFGGTVVTSSDGISWNKQSDPTADDIFDLRFLNGTFFGVGELGLIITSSDGISWDNKTSGVSTKLKEIAYGNGKYVIVGDNNTILTSTDTNSWTRTDDGTTAEYLWGIVFGNEKFVVIGSQNIISSSDGISWNHVAVKSGNGIAYSELKLTFDRYRWIPRIETELIKIP